MLNYLSKDCLRGGRNESTLSWSISAESFRTSDARVLGPDVKASLIISRWTAISLTGVSLYKQEAEVSARAFAAFIDQPRR